MCINERVVFAELDGPDEVAKWWVVNASSMSRRINPGMMKSPQGVISLLSKQSIYLSIKCPVDKIARRVEFLWVAAPLLFGIQYNAACNKSTTSHHVLLYT